VTTAEATQLLDIRGKPSASSVGAAYRAKVGEWGLKMRLATSPDERDRASQMLRRLKEADNLLTGKAGTAPPGRPAGPARSTRAGAPGRSRASVGASATTAAPPIRRAPSGSNRPHWKRPILDLRALRAVLIFAAVGCALWASAMHWQVDWPTHRAVDHSPGGPPEDHSALLDFTPATRTDVPTDAAFALDLTPETTPPSPQFGYLHVCTFPASAVLVNDREVAIAPFRVGEVLRLPPGPHTLRLRSRRHGERTVDVAIKSGQTTTVKCWLDTGQLELE